MRADMELRESHERAGFAGWRPSFWPPSAPLRWRDDGRLTFVGGGVLDAPQVWVVERLDFGGCLCWFVGRGFNPSTGGNVSPVRGVGDAAPYI